MEKAKVTAETLGFMNMEFITADIARYEPEVRPDLVYSLHACDTATDMAAYIGIKSNSRHILTVSCCQRYTKNQLNGHPLSRVTGNKVYKERLADMLGDTMRALIMEVFGYDTDIFEFSSSRHTDKNVMLRAAQVPLTKERKDKARKDYMYLKNMFNMEPRLMEFIEMGMVENQNVLSRVS